ncbi:unnamed protein product [Toxocara canis]|uniref:SHSP domain-containing protein n=1 Tax=Toxocara canis TaxID=6265 RepID=A0A183VD03_TOXCA|nr:unnamed protein product [Toxocara canis]
MTVIVFIENLARKMLEAFANDPNIIASSHIEIVGHRTVNAAVTRRKSARTLERFVGVTQLRTLSQYARFVYRRVLLCIRNAVRRSIFVGVDIAASRGWSTGFFPMREREHPMLTEFYRIKNPIIEEDGVKKFMLEFDVRRFKPEEVSVTASAKDNTLTVEAKHKDDNSKYEFSRKMTLPAGVLCVFSEVTCRFKTDGVLEVKAPYNPPPEAEPIKDTDIQVKHE